MDVCFDLRGRFRAPANFVFEPCAFDGIMQRCSRVSSRPRPAKTWYFATAYGLWCVVAVSGVVISFWKHRTLGRLSLGCYAAVFVLTLYFFVEARSRRLTKRDVGTRCFILFTLSYVPTFVHWFYWFSV
jgi:hypothetical protein